MAVKSFDPDNNPATAPPSLALSEVASEFGDPIRDSGAASNTGHKMSEFYRDGATFHQIRLPPIQVFM